MTKPPPKETRPHHLLSPTSLSIRSRNATFPRLMQGPEDDRVSRQEGETLLNNSTDSAPWEPITGLHDFAQGDIHVLKGPLDPAATQDSNLQQEVVESEKPRRHRSGSWSRPSSRGRRLSSVDDGEAHPENPPLHTVARPVRWRDLPNKGQLAILTLARLSEPLTQTSLLAYVFYQLKSFDQSSSDSTIASQAGILQGSFTAAQFLTAILWGRAADADWGGRKKVLLVGLFGTCVSCVGFGFSTSFAQAVFFRILGGVLNGNVGVMRTMISEIIKEKQYQSRAFLMLPMCFNVGIIIGPILGGLLADPVGSYPRLFGQDSTFGGKDGVRWMKRWPYALPNLLNAFFLSVSVIGVILGLQETLDTIRDKPDYGIRLGHSIATLCRRLLGRKSHDYSALGSNDMDPLSRSPGVESYDLEERPSEISTQSSPTPIFPGPKRKLPFRRIWTRNVLFTLLSQAILSFHVSTFINLWHIFLSSPRFDPSHPLPPSHTSQHLPFAFTGGLGMPPRTVGFAMAVLGAIGITFQLLVYPSVNARLGTLRSYRWSILCFPLAYCLAPYLAVIRSSTAPPAPASGLLVWLALSGVLFVQVLGRTFALPAGVILINNCSPHPSVLGTMHGIGQTVNSAGRTVGPVLGGWLYGLGLSKGVVGGVWWGLACVAAGGWVVSGFLYEGSGHEIWLEGEKEEEEVVGEE